MNSQYQVLQVKKGRNTGQWRWRLRGENGRIIATSHTETYYNLADCEAAVALVKGSGDAPIVYVE